MKAELATTTKADIWASWLEEVGSVEPRDSPAYYEAARLLDPGEPCCMRFRSPHGTLVLPFLRRPIPGAPNLCDVTSPYDFGGYILRAKGDNHRNLLNDFLPAWRQWCIEQGVVSEFMRLHPLRFVPPSDEDSGEFIFHQRHVIVDLSCGADAARASYSAKCRGHVKISRAGRLAWRGLAVGQAMVEIFAPLYDRSMARIAAPAYYYFPRLYFERLCGRTAGVNGFVVELEGKPVAAALFIASGTDLFYFLSASDREAWSLRPNHLLIDSVVGWASEGGFTRLHLGGGSQPLCEFKRAWSPASVPFYLRRAIHDPTSYASLAAAVPSKVRDTLPAHFPSYRAVEFMPRTQGDGAPSRR